MNISSVNTTTGYMSDKNLSSGSEKKMTDIAGSMINKDSVARIGVKGSMPIAEEQHLKKNIDRVIQAIQGPETTIERSVHEGTNHIVYKVKDKASGEVIREIPEEKLLDVAAKLMELIGIVVDEKI